MAKNIKVLVVDDSAYNRVAISQMLAARSGIEIAATAHDGVDAIAKTLRIQPDVITLDLEMPNMDGFTFLRWLMKERPTPVLVLSSRSDSRSVFRALELGAVDFLAKPEARISKSIETIGEELAEKVRAVLNLEMAKVKSNVALLAEEKAASLPRKEDDVRIEKSPIEVVAVASSTGGPPALQAIISSLPADFGAAVVIAQHMPPGFTKSFAERLNKLSSLVVFEAAAGDRVSPGSVLITPGGLHLVIRRDKKGLYAELEERSPSDKYVPSADRMMRSVAEVCGAAALGVVLTGMGNDGSQGAVAIRQHGGKCLVESEETAVIFGMPQEAINAGAADKVLPLGAMAQEIALRCRKSSRIKV